MTSIMQATKNDFLIVRTLFWEYLQWANSRVNEEFNVSFDTATTVEHDMEEIDKFMPPDGRLLLAFNMIDVVGCACMRTISPGIAELKRMYVRPIGNCIPPVMLTSYAISFARFVNGRTTDWRGEPRVRPGQTQGLPLHMAGLFRKAPSGAA